jgi:hypothetical protein
VAVMAQRVHDFAGKFAALAHTPSLQS